MGHRRPPYERLYSPIDEYRGGFDAAPGIPREDHVAGLDAELPVAVHDRFLRQALYYFYWRLIAPELQGPDVLQAVHVGLELGVALFKLGGLLFEAGYLAVPDSDLLGPAQIVEPGALKAVDDAVLGRHL